MSGSVRVKNEPISANQNVKTEPKPEPIPDENSRKRPHADVISPTPAALKRAKPEPQTVASTSTPTLNGNAQHHITSPSRPLAAHEPLGAPAPTAAPLPVSTAAPLPTPAQEPSSNSEVEPAIPEAQSKSAARTDPLSFQPAPLSSMSKDPDGSLKLCLTYGMVVIERNPETKEAEWIACRFCPIFGCITRKKKKHNNYVMAENKPFNVAKIERHLSIEHSAIWSQYRDADDAGKKKVFEGKALPRLLFFQNRVNQLKKSWGLTTKQDGKKKKRKKEKKNKNMEELRAERAQMEEEAAKEEEEHDRWFERNQKQKELRNELKDLGNGEEVANNSSDQPEKCLRSGKEVRPMGQENHLENVDSVTRSESEKLGNESSTNEKEAEAHLSSAYGNHPADWAGCAELRRWRARLPSTRMNVYGDARYKDDLVDKVKDSIFTSRNQMPLLWLPQEVHDLLSNGLLADSSYPYSEGDLFFNPDKYLLQEEPKTRKQAWDSKHEPRNFAWKEHLHVTVLAYLNRGLSIYTVEEMLEPMLNIVAPEWMKEYKSMKDMVWRIGNSICAESLRLLRLALKNRNSWLLLPTFAPHEAMGESGVEIFIPVLCEEFDLYFLHLISVRDGENVGDAVISMLQTVCKNWEYRIGGFYTHVSSQDKPRKAVEEKIMRHLGARAKQYPLRVFENGQREVEELAVGDICEMSKERLLQKVSMFMRPYLGYYRGKSEESVYETILEEQQALIRKEILNHKKVGTRHFSSWNAVVDWKGRELYKYMNGMQMIWRQEVNDCNGRSGYPENQAGGFSERHSNWTRCGTVKDWRCENVVDPALERTECAKNLTKMRCMLKFKMKFESRTARNRLYNYETAHMFDANWSNIMGR